MKNSSKKIFSLLLIMIMLISSTGVVNAASTNGNIYGAWYNASLTYSNSYTLKGVMSDSAEETTEPDPSLYFTMASYYSDGTIVDASSASGSGYCTTTCHAGGSSYGTMYLNVDGYSAGSLIEYY